jgi:hypothetical protein
MRAPRPEAPPFGLGRGSRFANRQPTLDLNNRIRSDTARSSRGALGINRPPVSVRK